MRCGCAWEGGWLYYLFHWPKHATPLLVSVCDFGVQSSKLGISFPAQQVRRQSVPCLERSSCELNTSGDDAFPEGELAGCGSLECNLGVTLSLTWHFVSMLCWNRIGGSLSIIISPICATLILSVCGPRGGTWLRLKDCILFLFMTIGVVSPRVLGAQLSGLHQREGGRDPWDHSLSYRMRLQVAHCGLGHWGFTLLPSRRVF